MLFKLLSSLLYFYKKLTTYPDYHIVSKVLEYEIDPDINRMPAVFIYSLRF